MRHSVLRGLLVFAFLVGTLSWPGAAGKALASSQNVVTPTAFDFGYVTVGQSVSYYFPLKNVSGRPIAITAASLAGWPGSLTLSVPVTLRPDQVVVAGPLTFAPTATGRYSSAIELTTDDATWPRVTLPVSGKALSVSPTIAVIPSAFDFGSVTVGQSASEDFVFKNVSARPVQITDAVVLGLPGFPGSLTLIPLPTTVQPGETIRADLIFAPTAAGWYSSNIEITTDDPSSSLVAAPVSGRGALPGASPSIVAVPSTFDFGYVTVGGSAHRDFVLKNVSAHPVQIADASLSGWPGSLTLALPLTLPPGGTVRAGPLTFAPSATGRYSSAIELTTDDATWPLVAVPVSGEALAVSPSIVSIPAAFDFGYVTVGQSVSRDFTLRNESAQPVSITDVSLLGLPGFPGDLAPLALPLILKPGEAVRAGPLTFAPSAAGWYSSAIELTTDDPASSLVAVPVSGRGALSTVLTRGTLPAVVAYGAGVELTGTLTSSDGTPIADRTVVLETSVDGSPWSKDAEGRTSSTGTFAISSPRLHSARYVRVEFEGDDRWAPALSTAALVKPRASLGTPVAPSTMSATRTYTVYGSLEPSHTAGSAVGKLYCYRLESGHWILRKTFTVSAYASSGQDRYRAGVRLASAGRWRMRAYHADAGHAPTYSGWRYVTVR